MTIEDAKQLQYRDVVHVNGQNNAHGKCASFRVNGKVHTWKRNLERVYVPIKYGLYAYGAITEHNLHLIHHEGDCNGKR